MVWCAKLFYLICMANVIIIESTKFQSGGEHLSSKVASGWHNDTTQIVEHNKGTKNKVNLTIYYEILCPASVQFFTQQLCPAVELLAPYLDIRLIPYGHARTFLIRGNYEFRCQHGPAECYGNKLQACVVDAVGNNTQAVLFNSCLLQYSAYRRNHGFDYNYIMRWCSYKHHTPVQDIVDCMHNGKASLLLKKNGDETHELNPEYVPFVLINGSSEKQDDATFNLISTVCKILKPIPFACR